MRGMLAVLVIFWVTLPPGAAQTSPRQASEEGRILSLENAWNQAQQVKDTKALDLLLAANLVFTDYDGTFMSKSQYLAGVSAETLHPQQIASLSMKVYFYEKSAIVTGLYLESGILNGKAYKRRERFTDTWVHVNDTWQCVASQSTLLSH